MKKKICSKCKKELPIDSYSKNKSKKDGYNSYCKKCMSNYYQENKYRIYNNRVSYMKEYNKEYYNINKETEAIRRKEYYNNNKEELNKKSILYYKEHKDEISNKRREYRQTLKGKIIHRLNERKRSHKLKSIEHHFTIEEWEEKLNLTKDIVLCVANM